ncbi:phosphate-binding protein [Mycobacterium gordonae]|uniref:Phosphate-binding protein n=1 Tax=Mycobacterium gordonae TaxID=1778 RepID=A0A0Q2MAU3_MYCGO|nr:phosphate-binding protein [Mycobacterium gordonae]
MLINRIGPFWAAFAATVLLASGCGGQNRTAPEPGSGESAVNCGGKKTLKASGSTAQANAMTRFVKAFEGACPGQTTDYTPDGSGAGIRAFLDNQTDFSGSDSPLSPREYADAQRRCGAPAWNLPVVFGPVAITYRVDGVPALTLDGPTAAKIFNGSIVTWNDPAIVALNPAAKLPSEPIHVVFRGDDSGTSDNFQRYLDTAGGSAWGKGAGKQFRGGVGEAAVGNEGTATVVKRTEGAISYNEWSFAQEQKLDMARIVTSAGPEPVEISADSVAKTIASAGIVNKNNDLVLDTISFYRPTQPGSYPIVLATYEIVCSKYPDAQVGAGVRAFLQSTIGSGQNGLADNGYIPIPDALKSRLSAAVNAIS